MKPDISKAPARRLVGVAEAADYWSCSPHTIRRRVLDGSLRGYRMPGKSRLILIDLNDLDAALKPIRSGRQ